MKEIYAYNFSRIADIHTLKFSKRSRSFSGLLRVNSGTRAASSFFDAFLSEIVYVLIISAIRLALVIAERKGKYEIQFFQLTLREKKNSFSFLSRDMLNE